MTEDELFERAMTLDPAERAEFLAGACAGDRALRQRLDRQIATDGATLDSSKPEATITFDDGRTATAAPERLGTSCQVIAGRYTLVEIIGEGGMGSVYLATQTEPVKRQVALKLIKVGMDSKMVLARFDAERQALALMDHPNIARIYDGGVAPSGQPFFVMELVKGIPLTDYCDSHQMSVKARLELFVQVCNAVQHAHQKGIIHRDLKPGNVLVTEVDGRPMTKVIDFGVAKATEQKLTDQSLSDTGAIVGTPVYMSPEQADPTSMDIDTRSDVYALGVMIYELLTGSPPIDSRQFKQGAILEMLRMVREVEPPRPSTKLSTADALPNIAAARNIEPAKLAKLLEGELDWVVMKAMDKDRTRRYESANGLARDILRYLADEVVEARPPSTGYRLKKFVKRHKGQVVAASLVLIALLAGIAGTTIGLFEARRQEAEAKRLEGIAREQEAEAKKQEAEAFKQAGLARDEANLKELARAEEARQKGIAEEKRQAAVVALKRQEKTTEALVGVLRNIDPTIEEKEGLPLRTLLARNLKEAADALQTGDVGDPLSTARMQTFLGTAFIGVGDAKSAVTVLDRAVTTYRDRLGFDDPITLDATNQLALAQRDNGQPEKALELLTDALKRSQATRGPDHLQTLGIMNNLAVTLRHYKQLAKAFPYYIEVETRTRATMGPKHQSTLAATHDLALAHKDLGRADKALPLLEDTLAVARTVLGDDHPFTLKTMSNLADIYGNARDLKKAMPLLLEALAGRRKKLGPTHPETLGTMHTLAMGHLDAGEPAKAVSLLEEELEGLQARFGADHLRTLNTVELLAQAYLVAGQLDKALPMMADTLTRAEAKFGKDHPTTLGLMNNLAASYWQAKQFDKAVSMFERLLPLHEAKYGKDHPLTINVLANLGVNYGDAGRLKEAVVALENAVLKMGKHPPINVARLSWVPLALNSTYERAGLHDKAEASYRKGFDDAVKQFGEDHANSATAGVLLATNLLKQAKFADAEPLLVKAVATREKAAPDAWTTFNTRSLLGGALLGQKKYADAEPLLVKGYEGMKAREKTIPPLGSTRIPEALDRLIELYTATKKPDEAKKYEAIKAELKKPEVKKPMDKK